jgi:hypothetical protein
MELTLAASRKQRQDLDVPIAHEVLSVAGRSAMATAIA